MNDVDRDIVQNYDLTTVRNGDFETGRPKRGGPLSFFSGVAALCQSRVGQNGRRDAAVGSILRHNSCFGVPIFFGIAFVRIRYDRRVGKARAA